MAEGITNYQKYRGRCREMSQAAVAEDPTLRLVRGYYRCPIWGSREAHWWTVRPDGTIYDPTCLQFPSAAHGEYEEFDGWFECAECGKRVQESDTIVVGHYALCSDACAKSLVGL